MTLSEMDFTEADIAKLVSALSLHEDDFQKEEDFTMTQLYNQHKTFDNFNSIRFLYKLHVPRTDDMTVMEFIDSLEKVFTRLLKIATLNRDKPDNDYVRFHSSKAPEYQLSMSIMPLRDLKMQYFMDTFKKRMQSEKGALAKGCNTSVEISLLSLENQRKRIAKRKSKQCIFVSG